ncbi:MAG: selenocysteine-specific translation elongation factor, partial [Thermoanaerobaculia bacterium]
MIRAAIVGTAGHVDHGKTALVEALTGIDCDRLAEEKLRGITLDLGFAKLASPAGARAPLDISFIDVPGHERFLHNALAGLGGVRLLLLVVAADEGVRAQTREHLAIAGLLELPGLIVALNKIDTVDAGVADLVELEISELLAGTRFSGAPILRVSARTGAGVPELRTALELRAGSLDAPRPSGPMRLPIDRAFLVRGQGVVVTGTLLCGTVRAGDSIELLPARQTARVRSVEVHGEAKAAIAGQRAALQLSGIELGDIARGMEVATPGAFRTTRRLLVRWTTLDGSAVTFDRSSPVAVRFHLYASETSGMARALNEESLAPGDSGLVEILLERPVVAARGDRFVARRPSPPATIGGGVILDPWWRRKRRGETIDRAAALAGDDRRALAAWAAEAGARGLTAAAAAARIGASAPAIEEELAALVAGGALVRLDRDL